MEQQYRQQMEQQRIYDESKVTAYRDDPEIDHVFHAECGKHQGRGDKSNFLSVRHQLPHSYEVLTLNWSTI